MLGCDLEKFYIVSLGMLALKSGLILELEILKPGEAIDSQLKHALNCLESYEGGGIFQFLRSHGRHHPGS